MFYLSNLCFNPGSFTGVFLCLHALNNSHLYLLVLTFLIIVLLLTLIIIVLSTFFRLLSNMISDIVCLTSYLPQYISTSFFGLDVVNVSVLSSSNKFSTTSGVAVINVTGVSVSNICFQNEPSCCPFAPCNELQKAQSFYVILYLTFQG